MKRTMVYLPDELHKDIKRLAVERETTMAALLREALEALRDEDMDDLAHAREFLSAYRPGSGKSLEQYHKERAAREKA